MPSKRGYCNQCSKRWGNRRMLLGEEGKLNRKFRFREPQDIQAARDMALADAQEAV